MNPRMTGSRVLKEVKQNAREEAFLVVEGVLNENRNKNKTIMSCNIYGVFVDNPDLMGGHQYRSR